MRMNLKKKEGKWCWNRDKYLNAAQNNGWHERVVGCFQKTGKALSTASPQNPLLCAPDTLSKISGNPEGQPSTSGYKLFIWGHYNISVVQLNVLSRWSTLGFSYDWNVCLLLHRYLGKGCEIHNFSIMMTVCRARFQVQYISYPKGFPEKTQNEKQNSTPYI